MDSNTIPPRQPGKTWVIRSNADHVLYMCTMCQITPEQYYRRLDAIEEYEKAGKAIAAAVLARHQQKMLGKPEKEDYNVWVAKKAKQSIRKRR